MTYFNTTKLKGKNLAEAQSQTYNQEQVISLYFTQNPKAELTPFQVNMAILRNAPITSVRRAMTNLTKNGVLEKLEIQRPGKYGKPNHLWRLKQIITQGQLF